jgi:UDP-2,4-diacetamido-2,4,6-trideoxy-beta-L-altropyranose hydrolase
MPCWIQASELKVDFLNIAFRVDASNLIGIGHVMRCLVLADILHAQGANCFFVCRPHAGHLADLIYSRGHFVCLLSEPFSIINDDSSSYVSWLGSSQDIDADETLAILLPFGRPDWLVVDHYGIDVRWETRLRTSVGKLAVIDDLANRLHKCDLLLDQNWFGKNLNNRYKSLVPQNALLCLGPSYALLKPEFALLKKWRPKHDGFVRRLLIFFGGSDQDDLTTRALLAMRAPEFDHLILDVVLGANHPNVSGVTKLVQERPGTFLHRNLPSLAGLMLRADLMLGAGGSTNWERMCLGLPAVVISIAENQMQVNNALAKDKFIIFLGSHNQVKIDNIRVAMQRAIADTEFLCQSSRIGFSLVAGTGASLVAKLMLAKD